MRALLSGAFVLFVSFNVFATPVDWYGSDQQSSVQKDELAQGIDKVTDLIRFYCDNIYPRPSTKECIDKVLHGIGNSFDPHSEYMNNTEAKAFEESMRGNFGGLGIEVFKKPGSSPVTVVNAIDGTPAQRAGLRAGDLIMHIISGEQDVSTISLKNVGDAVDLLRGKPGTKVTVKVARKGVEGELSFTLTREVIKIAQIEGDLIRDGERTFAYIHDKVFDRKNRDEFKEKFDELKEKAGGRLDGLVISVEDDPGGLLNEAVSMSDLFIDFDGPSPVLTRTNDGMEIYGTDPRDRSGIIRTQGDITDGLPILVIVNGGTASAAEILSKTLQHFDRAVIAGPASGTFEKGIVQTITPRDGALVKYTSSEYYIGTMNDAEPVQCVGVRIDIPFDYPGVKRPTDRPTECTLSSHVNTAGKLPGMPEHRPIKETDPQLFGFVSKVMLPAYIKWKMPKLQAEEERRKLIEQQ